MNKAILTVLLVLAVGAIAIAAPASGETRADVDGEFLNQFVVANRSLDELVQAVRGLAQQQEADVLVRRLDIEERAILELRPELDRTRQARDEARRELDQMRDNLDQASEGLRDFVARGIPTAEAKLGDLERRLQELQGELDDRQRESAKLKGLLDEQVEAR